VREKEKGSILLGREKKRSPFLQVGGRGPDTSVSAGKLEGPVMIMGVVQKREGKGGPGPNSS